MILTIRKFISGIEQKLSPAGNITPNERSFTKEKDKSKIESPRNLFIDLSKHLTSKLNDYHLNVVVHSHPESFCKEKNKFNLLESNIEITLSTSPRCTGGESITESFGFRSINENSDSNHYHFRFSQIEIKDMYKHQGYMTILLTAVIISIIQEFPENDFIFSLRNTSKELGESYCDNQKIYSRVLTESSQEFIQERFFPASKREQDLLSLNEIFKEKISSLKIIDEE